MVSHWWEAQEWWNTGMISWRCGRHGGANWREALNDQKGKEL